MTTAQSPARYNQLAPVTRTLLIPVCCCLPAAYAQQPSILLDPAHGGADSGAHIADRLPEKQVTLDLAGRLASLLRARGFAVTMSRETDVDLSNDARAALANNAHPIACILLHATGSGSGSGVHLYTSALHQKLPQSGSAIRWDDAQAAYIDRSHALAADLKSALQRSRITASEGQTWIRPLDNMQCPAVAVEVAPQKNGDGAEDRTYQGQVANALANTLLLWRGKVAGMAPPEPMSPAAAVTPTAAAPSGATVTKTVAAPSPAKVPPGNVAQPQPPAKAQPTTPNRPTATPAGRSSPAPATVPSDRTEP